VLLQQLPLYRYSHSSLSHLRLCQLSVLPHCKYAS
jgi:hypothetical protein